VYYFDGTEFLEATNCPVTEYPFTMGAWVNPPSFASRCAIGIYSNSVSSKAIYVGIVGPGSGYIFRKDGAAQATIQATGVATNDWSHIVGVFTQTNDVDLYINGSWATNDTAGVTISLWDRVGIGARADSLEQDNFIGYIDDPAIHTNKALSAAEVLAWYNDTSSDR
jgi:hypothetical protein